MKTQYWLINLSSGNHEGAHLAEQLQGVVSVAALDFSRIDEQLAHAGKYDQLVVAGGDGTFASVLTSKSLPDLPVALVPLGTANDLAREFGNLQAIRGKPWKELPAMIQSYSEHRLSTWELIVGAHTKSFCNYVSLGFEGAVVSDFHEWRNRRGTSSRIRNRLMYFWFGIRRWFVRLKGIQIMDKEGRLKTCPSTRGIICTNVKSHMGCGIVTDEADASDATLECVVASSPLDYLRMVSSPFKILPPLKSILRSEQIEISKIPACTPIQVDGEAHPPITEGGITIRLRGFVRVLAP